MSSTYDIQHMFFKRQTGIENHTKQFDGFSEVNARPRDVYTTGHEACQLAPLQDVVLPVGHYRKKYRQLFLLLIKG